MVSYNGKTFKVEYDGKSMITVSPTVLGDFDGDLWDCNHIINEFQMSKPGSVWGCDGVGYAIEKAHGRAYRNKSGVGPRKFQQGLKALG